VEAVEAVEAREAGSEDGLTDVIRYAG